MNHINIIFEGQVPNARFVEIEDDSGKSIAVGEWIERENGLWALRISPSAFSAHSETPQS